MRISNIVLAALVGTLTFQDVQAIQLESQSAVELQKHHKHHHKADKSDKKQNLVEKKSSSKGKDADEREDATSGISPEAAAARVEQDRGELERKKKEDAKAAADKVEADCQEAKLKPKGSAEEQKAAIEAKKEAKA